MNTQWSNYLQVVVVEVALWRLAGDLVFMMRLNNSVEEVAEQDVRLGIARDTANRYRTGPITFIHKHYRLIDTVTTLPNLGEKAAVR